MSATSAHANPLRATLELSSGPRLQGMLESTESGELRLSGVSLAPGQSGAASLNLRSGERASLHASYDTPLWKQGTPVAVTVSGVNGRDLLLQIVDTYTPAAKSCLQALSLVSAASEPAAAAGQGEGEGHGEESLLVEFSRTSQAQLSKRFGACLEDLRLYLMELTLRARGGDWAQKHHDIAADAVKNRKNAILANFTELIAGYFDELTPDEHSNAAPPLPPQDTALNLVDIDQFEHDLAVERLTRTGSERFDVPLESLTLRLAEVIDADPLRVRLPIHIAQIATAFNTALQDQGIPQEVAPDIFDFFDKRFVRELGPFYSQLNLLFANAGVLPEIEEELKAKGSRLRRPGPLSKSPDRQVKPPSPDLPTDANVETQTASSGGTLQEMAAAIASPGGPHQTGGPGLSGMTGTTQAAGPSVASAAPATPVTSGAPPTAGAPGTTGVPSPTGVPGNGVAGAANFADRLYSSLIQAVSAQRQQHPQTPGAAAATAAGGASATAATAGPLAAGVSTAANTTGAVPGTHAAGGAIGTPATPGNPADPAAVATALDTLQRDASIREALAGGQALRDYLDQNRSSIDSLQETDGLSETALNQLELVDNLFVTLNSRLAGASEIQPVLGDLQVPLAKLAMLEPQFMLDREHAARGVVDAVAQLAAMGNFPNKALEGRVNDIVGDIVEGYDRDSAVFGEALTRLQTLVTQQERALSRNVERVVRTQEGQEKLRRARHEVGRAIGERIRPPEAPEVLLELIDNGWRDLLVLTHIKEGGDSQALETQLTALDVLSGWLLALHNSDAEPDEVARESAPFLERIGQQLASALPTQVAYRETLRRLGEILAGRSPVVMRVVAETAQEVDSTQVRARVDELPRLRRWVKRVEQLESGSWLSYKDREGVARRMQLAWISEDKDRFIFVNERGQKNADLSAIQLARQLSRGVQPPAPVDNMGMVDRSMYDTLEQLQKTLSFSRNHDSLTRLINKETFLDQMTRALRHAQARRTRHAVLYIDIDQFGLVNELYDQVNGDQVLLEFGKLLSQLHGKKTSSARIDGDEFAVLLLDRDEDQTREFAEKIRQDIEASSVDIEGEQVGFTVSIGTAPILEHSPAVEEILAAARAAAVSAKQNGRNQVAAYSEDQTRAQDYRREQTRTRQDLEQALETDRFMLRAQPIQQTAVNSGETVRRHYELLLGWRDKSGNITSPGEFIQSAERYGFMTLVDRWVIKEAFAWISKLMDEQKVVPHLSINLSGSSITDNDFMDYLFDQISEFGVGTNRICFEITETGTISNLVKAADFVRAFRNIGCKFSIDDFGTGLASHDFLKELPVDFVKIDGSFIKEIDTNQNDYAMTRSINDLAHFLGQQTIAESVENETIVEKLQEIGVDFLQGWGIGKPRPLTEIAGDLSSIEK